MDSVLEFLFSCYKQLGYIKSCLKFVAMTTSLRLRSIDVIISANFMFILVWAHEKISVQVILS